MRRLLLSGASVALLSLGGFALPTLADSPSLTADPIGDPTLVQIADNGMTTDQGTTDPAASETQATEPQQPAETAPDAAATPTAPSVTAPSDTTTASEPAVEQPADDADKAAEAATPDPEEVPTGQLAAEPVQPPQTVMVAEVLDADVIDATGEDVASVEDVLMDPDGKLSHVVVSYGGFLGIGAKEVLIPWEQVSFNAAQETLQIPGNEADLDAAPAYVTQEELLDQQQAERDKALATQPADTSVNSAPQQAQTPDPE